MYGILAIHEVYIQLDCVEGVSKLPYSKKITKP